MDFSKLVLSRRTVHNYRSEAVPEKLVEEALSLSLWSMNHRLTFPWVYISVGPQARARLADLAVELKGAKEPLSEVKAKATRDNVLNPSHLIVLGMKLNADPKIQHEDYATLAASVQIAALALWEKGIASKWSTGGFLSQSRSYEILGVDPNEVRLEGGLMIGIPATLPAAPERPALSGILRTTT